MTIKTIAGATLVGSATTILALSAALSDLAVEFAAQSNQAYESFYPERANDTPEQKINDLSRDAFRHT